MFKYIKTTIAGIILILTSCTTQAADDWTPLNTQLEIAHLITHVMDFKQTTKIAKNPDKYYEVNLIMGKHPSISKVRNYFLLTAIAHPIVAYNLSSEHRSVWQISTSLLSLAAVLHNKSIGLTYNF